MAMVLGVGCGPTTRSKEKVQQAILSRLETNSGLDLKKLDITTTSVSFDKNMAYAAVAFHKKGDSNLKSGITMTYTLVNRGGKWAVVKVGDSHGRSEAGQAPHVTGELPPGHPPVNSTDAAPSANSHGGVQAR